jgi:hypothetical protein
MCPCDPSRPAFLRSSRLLQGESDDRTLRVRTSRCGQGSTACLRHRKCLSLLARKTGCTRNTKPRTSGRSATCSLQNVMRSAATLPRRIRRNGPSAWGTRASRSPRTPLGSAVAPGALPNTDRRAAGKPSAPPRPAPNRARSASCSQRARREAGDRDRRSAPSNRMLPRALARSTACSRRTPPDRSGKAEALCGLSSRPP